MERIYSGITEESPSWAICLLPTGRLLAHPPPPVLRGTISLHPQTAALFPNGRESRGLGSDPRAPCVRCDGGHGGEGPHLAGEAGDTVSSGDGSRLSWR